jgi:hypothetical protein
MNEWMDGIYLKKQGEKGHCARIPHEQSSCEDRSRYGMINGVKENIERENTESIRCAHYHSYSFFAMFYCLGERMWVRMYVTAHEVKDRRGKGSEALRKSFLLYVCMCGKVG